MRMRSLLMMVMITLLGEGLFNASARAGDAPTILSQEVYGTIHAAGI